MAKESIPSEHWDCAIVGGGPSGLTAATHLAWHNRRVLVLDRRTGPLFFTLEALFNVPGLAQTRGIDIQKQLLQQALDLGAEHCRANVESASGAIGDFVLTLDHGEVVHATTLLLATGVARYHPTVDGDHRPCFKYAGKGNLYYCPDCEAPEIRDKDTVVIATASAESGAGMALGLSTYASRTRLLLTGDPASHSQEITDRRTQQLGDRGIEVLRGQLAELIGERSQLHSLRLKDDTIVSAEKYFVSSPAVGRTDLAQELGVEIAQTGNHAQPKSQRGDTNVAGVWIAGDLRPQTQQVAVAMGTGNIAAVMIDQYLRREKISNS